MAMTNFLLGVLLVVQGLSARVKRSTIDSCRDVAGASKASFFSKFSCECPEGQVITGEDADCWGKTGEDRGFSITTSLKGKGCVCAQPASHIGQGEDGNPKGWNRFRRCDASGYEPLCGACEGVGGLVTSDDNKDFVAAKCWFVAGRDALKTAPVQPVWNQDFTVRQSHEILIGIKKDPACFQSFPFSDSAPEMCYKPQEVVLRSDSRRYKALRMDAVQSGNAWNIVGNISSTIFHQGKTMWITNQLPLGITQTICTEPHPGFDASSGSIYPLQYNWTKGLDFVAREIIDVEYGVGKRTLDHWILGPHHVWTETETGIIVRMWQPWNGLQVFEPGTYSADLDFSAFSELSEDGSRPPKAAMPGGSTFRIKCGDDGFLEEAAAEQKVGMVGQGRSLASDLKRAREKVPRPEYKGDSFADMSRTLNGWLMKHAPNSRECEQWTVTELQQLQVQLLALRDPDLDEVYHGSTDSRRLLHENAQTMTREWDELNKMAASDPQLAKMHRDGHCHEAVMWYVHHVPETLKAELKSSIALPLLSYMRHDIAYEPESKAGLSQGAATLVGRSYEKKVTCASCHANVVPQGITPIA